MNFTLHPVFLFPYLYLSVFFLTLSLFLYTKLFLPPWILLTYLPSNYPYFDTYDLLVRGKSISDFDYTRTISAANEAASLYSVIEGIKRQVERYPTTEEEDADIIRDKVLFGFLSYNQRMAVRHRRNEKRLLKRTIAALEKQVRTRGLDDNILERAEGSTLGKVLPGEKGKKQRTALEDRLEKMGLPVDLR